jgi:ATP-dependent protease ClpP protease subunit
MTNWWPRDETSEDPKIFRPFGEVPQYWYNFRMTETPTQTTTARVQRIWCNAQITKKMEDVFVNLVLNQAQQGENIAEYVVYLTTLGGSPFSALNLYNFLKSLPQTTTVYNMGTVYSAGVIFFLGFQNRFGVPDCSFMIHPTTTSRNFIPETLSVFDLSTELEKLKATDDKTHEVILKETTTGAAKPFTLKGSRSTASSRSAWTRVSKGEERRV